MGPVHFTDGFDRPDTIAFGLDAPRLVAVVIGALSAYAVMQAPLPMALRIAVAVLVALVSTVLGWARYAGRPVLTWAWLALRFTLSPRTGGGAVPDAMPAILPVAAPQPAPEPPATQPAAAEPSVPEEDGVPVWAQWLRYEKQQHTDGETAQPALPPDTVESSRPVPVVVVMDHATPVSDDEVASAPDRAVDGAAHQAAALDDDDDAEHLRDAEEPSGADVLQLPVQRNDRTPPQPAAAPIVPHDLPPPVFVGAPRRLTFFSLNGGAGRTTLATEVACILAARGHHLAADGTARPLNVALLDLDLRSASVAVRLGIPQPTLADYLTRGAEPANLDACLVRHPTGVRALLGPPKPLQSGALEPARVAEMVHRLERDGAQFVVIDVGADLDAVTTWVLSAVHDIFVVLTPTAGGVQDAYRTTAALRRLGFGHKLRYVVNRARGDVDLSEVMGDLGGRIAAVIPDDPAIEEAENNHRITALDGHGRAATALHDLAAHLYPLSPAAQRARASWLPWRRRAG